MHTLITKMIMPDDEKKSSIMKIADQPSDAIITNGITNLHINADSSQSAAVIDDDVDEEEYTYAVAKIKAVFYPKFDNSRQHDKIRIKMIDKVSKGEAVLEVSLKHSGSLFMYAGHESGAFSKNDLGTIYTAAGVFVLGRTFLKAWGSEATEKQAEFNDFLERQHMNISMELVTDVLGDHGQKPREDYVVVTAVTELGNGKPKFYSTPEIIAFCRKWRLPTNHVWLFSTRKSVTTFFYAYDQLYEEGTATSVCKLLDEVADISVPGSVDHVKFQGEILEGLVARIVSHESIKEMDLVLKNYPSPVEEVHQDLGPGLREIFAANRSDDEKQQILIKALLQNTGTSFCPNDVDWFGIEAVDVLDKNGDPSVSIFLPAKIRDPLVSKFLQANPSDYSTAKLKEIVSLIRGKLSKDVNFKCYDKIINSESLNFKMVIHVLNDSAFLKYQKQMRDNRDLWPLYRGFFVDINLFKASKEKVAEIAKICNDIGNNRKGSDEDEESGLEDENANLMIKLKFLKYKLRTFLIRNGLSDLFNNGRIAYTKYYRRQMDIWKISKEKKTRLMEMLEEWAEHITKKMKDIQLESSNQLSEAEPFLEQGEHITKKMKGIQLKLSNYYLSEAEPFLEQYAKRSPENQALIGFSGDPRTKDLLAIVSKKGLEPSISSHEAVEKKEGLIVFFPGIPGCAKSTLCDAIINASEGLEDDRPIYSLMADEIEGKRKYWQKVAKKLLEEPYSIVLADKNAPNVEVWDQIEEMSGASAVPIVADSEGTELNPFSLDALAVFMYRVLNRVNHPGDLHKSCPNVGFALLMFYHLYNRKNRAEFETELIERFGSLVKMPLLKSERSPLPDSVKTVMEEGISLYRLHISRHGKKLKSHEGSYITEWVEWEKQMREVISENSEYLTSIQVPFEFAVNSVLEQLKIIIKGQYVTPISEKRNFIVYAAIDVPLLDVHNLLSHISKSKPDVASFLEKKDVKNSLKKAHITLAHKRSHGETVVADYEPFVNQKVVVDVTALLFSDQLAALEAHPGFINDQKINSENEWPHLTLWTAKDVPPKEANELPDLVLQGKATRVEIDPPFRINGVLQIH